MELIHIFVSAGLSAERLCINSCYLIMPNDYFDFLYPDFRREKPASETENGGFVNVTLRADMDCQVLCDGDFMFLLNRKKKKKKKLPVGEHFLQFIAVDKPELCIDKKVDYPVVGKNYVLLVDEFLKKEAQGAQEKALKEAEEKERRCAAEEARAKEEKEARMRAEAEARARVEAEERLRRAEAEAMERAKERAKAEARLRAEAEAKRPQMATIRIKSNRISGLEARYEGFILNGLPEGRGVAYYDNGDVYDGEWRGGKKEGNGNYTWQNEVRYEGNWVDDAMSGLGTLHYPNGNRFEGEFRNGFQNGKGVLIYSNGIRYAGNWKDGNRYGSYRFYFKEGGYLDGNSWYGNLDNGGVDGFATDQDGEQRYYDKGRLVYIIERDGIRFNSKNVLVVLKYQDHDSGGLYTKVVGVYYDIEEGRKAAEAEYCGYMEHVISFTVDLAGLRFPSSKCYIGIKSFDNSTRQPQFLLLDSRRDPVVSAIETQAGEKISWGQVQNFVKKCHWKLFEQYIQSFPSI